MVRRSLGVNEIKLGELTTIQSLLSQQVSTSLLPDGVEAEGHT